MLPINVNECHIVAGPRESATDDSADGSRADDDHARAHVNLPGDLTMTSQRYWKLAGPSTEVCGPEKYLGAERGLEGCIPGRHQTRLPFFSLPSFLPIRFRCFKHGDCSEDSVVWHAKQAGQIHPPH